MKWKCLHATTTSAKKCIDYGHRDCLEAMCDKYDILEIEKIKINFDKNSVGNRCNTIDVDILSYMCELSDFDTMKYLIEEKNYNPNNKHTPLRGYTYLMSSICYGGNFDIFLYIYNDAARNLHKIVDLVYPCMYGNIDIIKYIYDNMTEKEKSDHRSVHTGLFHGIARNHYEVVKFLIDRYNCSIDDNSLPYYAERANLEMWKYLAEGLNVTVTKDLIKAAKKYNKDKDVYVFMSTLV